MFTAQSLYGATPQVPQVAASPLQAAASDDLGTGWRALVDVRNPLVIFGGILAVTVGLAGVSGSARLGSLRASASAGKA